MVESDLHLRDRTSTGASNAPVVVFAYARPEHLQRTIESLRANPEAASTVLHVLCDGPRSSQDQSQVDAVRKYVASIEGFASVHRVFREHNLGLAQSVIEGATELLRRHEQLIVLEDDLVLSPHFLRYMNQALVCYRHDDQVASVHGYCYPVDTPLPETFFLRGADCWGWATWARAWRHFEADGRTLLQRLRERRLTRAFDLDGSYRYTAMLEDQVAGRNNSWAIRWHASCFLRDMLTLYPGRSLVDNIGNDASGTHCDATGAFSQAVTGVAIEVERIALVESVSARKAFARFLRAQKPSLAARARQLLWNLYGRAA
jgi:hypothetical protein